MKIEEKDVEVFVPKIVDFKTLSQMGLVYRLNKVLHPLGLALGYQTETGISDGVLVADDGQWEYSPELEKLGKDKFDKFLVLSMEYDIKEIVEMYRRQRNA